MKKSDSIIEISKALVNFQSEINNPFNSKENPFFKSGYAPLSDILNLVRPVLSKNGLAILQDVETINNDVKISTMLIHISGEWIEQNGMIIKLEKQTAQSAGSAITYGRRYMLSAFLGIASEDDDDGNGDLKNKPEPKKESIFHSEYSKIISNAATIEEIVIIKKELTEKFINKKISQHEANGLSALINIQIDKIKQDKLNDNNKK